MPKSASIIWNKYSFFTSKQFRATLTYQQDKEVGVTGEWNVPRGEVGGSIRARRSVTKLPSFDPPQLNYRAGDYLKEKFSFVIQPGQQYLGGTAIYSINTNNRVPKNNVEADFLFFVQWSHEVDGSLPETQYPANFEFTFNGVRDAKAIGKAFVKSFVDVPPQYSAIISQRVLLTAIDSIPEFEVWCKFAFTMPGLYSGHAFLHGLIAAHCGFSSLQLESKGGNEV